MVSCVEEMAAKMRWHYLHHQHHATSHLFTVSVYWVVPSTCSPLEFSNNWTEIIPGILMGSPDMRLSSY